MNKKEQDKVVSEVKSILPAVVQYQQSKGYCDFDYGYLYGADNPIWEVSFFNEGDDVVEYFTGKTTDDIIKQLK